MANNKVLEEAAKFLLETAQQGKSLVMEHGPVAVQQWLKMEALEGAFFALFGLVFLGILGWCIRLIKADDEVFPPTVMLALGCGLLGVIFFVCGLYQFIAATYMPEGYLLAKLIIGAK